MRTERPLLALGALWVAYAAWVLSGAGLAHPVINDLFYLLFPWASVLSAVGAARRATLPDDFRQAWRWIAAGLGVNAGATVAWLALDVGHPVVKLPPWTALTFLLYYPLVARGLMALPMARRLRAEARRGWLDGALVITGLVTISWYLASTFTGPFVAAGTGGTLIDLATLASDLFLAWAVLTLAREEDDPDVRPSVVMLASGLLVLAVGDATLTLDQSLGTYRSGRPNDALTSLAYVVLALAAALQRRARARVVPEERPITARAAIWPTIALVATLAPLAVEIFSGADLDQIVLLVGGLSVMTLELARQADMRRQNRRLATARGEQDARFRSLVQYSHDMTFVCDRAGRLAYTSPSAPRQLGMGTSTLTEGDLFALVHPADRAHLGALLTDVGPTTPARPAMWRMGADGTWRDVEGFVTDLTGDATVRGIVLNVRDVSERERLEEQLRQAQKLEAVGRLAGGIAHDFNNILAAVLANAQLLREAHDGPEAADIEDAARRGAALTRQLLQFSRGEAPAPGAVHIDDVVRGIAPMLRRLIPSAITMVIDTSSPEAIVWVDRGQLEQVILNLAINARDAMPEGGTLRLRSVVEGAQALLIVSDTGVGMDEATRARAFEPFFTTKPRGRGTGLGLATVYGIVTKAGGDIAVVTHPRSGTEMRVSLPRAADAPPVPLTSGETAAVRTTRTILVVDDEDTLRLSICRFLERRGYRALAARDGLDALDKLADVGWAVDLVLTDIMMPRLDGIALAERVLSHPHGPVVLCMTGHAGRAVEAPTTAPWHPDHVLAKPFDLGDLVDRIAAALAVAR